MNTIIGQRIQLVAITLIIIMALTRFGHVGSAFSLPDASLAVFFLAGFTVSGLGFLVLLLLEAGLIDYLAITQFNVSDFCMSPAYLCLIPTYAVLWFAGNYCKAFRDLRFADSSRAFGVAAFATTIAYLISNGSFYVLSGQFGPLSWGHYFTQAVQYYPSYVSAALLYIVIGLAIVKLKKAMQVMAAVES